MEIEEAWDSITLRTGSVKMGNGEHVTVFDMSEFWDRLKGSDCNDNGPTSLAKLFDWAGDHSNSPDVFSGFQDKLPPMGAK